MTVIARRTGLKVVHWTMVPLFAWFTLVQPSDVERIGRGAVLFHSIMGLVFVTLALVWAGDYFCARAGRAARAEADGMGATISSDSSIRR